MKSTFESFLKSSPVLQKHFADTEVVSPDCYMGQEHIWKVALDAGVTQESATILFKTLAFPRVAVRHKVGSCRNILSVYPYNPVDNGVIIAQRSEVGLPQPPAEVSEFLNTGSLHIITGHQNDYDHRRTYLSTVVQAGSLVDFAERLHPSGRLDKVKFRHFGATAARGAKIISEYVSSGFNIADNAGL